MRKVVKRVLIFFAVVIVLVVGVAAYFGFVSGVSTLFGSNKPRDLGVVSTPVHLDSVQAKLGQQFVTPAADPHAQLELSPSNQVDVVISQEEYSQHITRLHPLGEVQVKFTGDTFEASGRLERSRIPAFVRTLGVSGVSDTEILEFIDDWIPFDPVFYFVGSARGANDDVTISLTRAEIGRFPVSSDTASQILEGYLESVLESVPGFSIDELTIADGMMHFNGTATAEVPEY